MPLPRTALASALLIACACAAAESFRFDWPVPGEVRVTAHAEKRGEQSTAAYTVRLEPLADGELGARFEDFRFLNLNGVDATEASVAAQLGPLTALTSALPTLRLSPDGQYLGTAGLEAVTERVFAALEGQLDPATLARLREQFASPRMRALMQQKSGELWNAWVGAWNGVDIEPGGRLQASVPVEVLGRTLAQKILVEHLGPAPRYDGRAHLRMTTLLEGPEVVSLVAGLIEGLAPPGERVDPNDFSLARSTTVLEVITDAATLRPRWASVLREVFIRRADGERHERVDRQTFTFEWP